MTHNDKDWVTGTTYL